MARFKAVSERNGSANDHASPNSNGDAEAPQTSPSMSPRPSQSTTSLYAGTEQERTPLERALASVRRNWVLALICVLLVPAAALSYSLLQTTEYTAEATVLFTDDVSESDPERVAATILQLGTLEQISAQTAGELSAGSYSATEIADKVEAEPAGMSDLIGISATDPDPQTAAQIANEFAEQFIVFRRNANRERILESRALVQAEIEQLSPQEQGSPAGQALAERERELGVQAAVETGDAQVVQEATVPDSPSSPKTKLNVALGLLLGIVLGIGVALLRDQLDRRLKEAEEVEDAFRLPILATIPESPEIDALGLGAEPTGEEREAFGMLRANLHYFNLAPSINSQVGQPVNTVLVTSPSSQDGKTTVSWNLAAVEARSGKKVLYVEADMRRPSLTAALGLAAEEDTGLSLVLAGALGPEAAIRPAQGVDVIGAGPPPPNPAELIDSPRMGELLSWAKEKYDRVVIDTPPTTVVADAVPLTAQVDGVVVVVRLRHSSRDGVEQLRDQLAHTEAATIGIVVNGVAPRPDDNYYRTPTDGGSFSRAYDRLSSGKRS
jgi:capsular exopolysaccharide synthesis family protein